MVMLLAESCQGNRATWNVFRRTEAEGSMKKKEVIFDYFTCLCKSLRTSVFSTAMASISCLNFSHLSVKGTRSRYPPPGGIYSERC